MKTYIGTKMIKAQPMTRAEYNLYRGWELPEDENGADEGYLVEYIDGGQANHPGHKGYISWSPVEVFNRAYRKISGLTFSQALEAMKAGYCVARAGWGAAWVCVVQANNYCIYAAPYMYPQEEDTNEDTNEDTKGVNSLPWIGLKTEDEEFCAWQPSQTDMLAEDWEVLDCKTKMIPTSIKA